MSRVPLQDNTGGSVPPSYKQLRNDFQPFVTLGTHKKTRPYDYAEKAGRDLAGMDKQLPPPRVGAAFASIPAKLKSLDEWLRYAEHS